MTARPKLRELAARLGIVPEYVDQTGRFVRRTSDATRENLLAVIGFDAPTEDAARGWLDELDHEERTTILDPVRVVERDEGAARRVRIVLPPGIGSAEVQLTLLEEAGHTWTVEQTVRGSATLRLPTPPPYGYHRVRARIRGRDSEWHAEQLLIVVPSSCVRPDMMLGKSRRVIGTTANLYTLRREHDWGIGDFAALTQLAEWTASRKGEFVGVNPLHALYNRGWEISPYGPVSRLFRNHIYIDVQSVPELEHSPEVRATIASPGMRERLAELRAATHVDYDGVIAVKEQVLRELHRTFKRRASSGGPRRAQEYEDFVRLREPEITRFATWMAIAEDSRMPDWRHWPESMQDPTSPSVTAFAAAHADHIDFFKWLQFEASRQLQQAADRARVSGMQIGIYQDLAIGTSRGGSDTWMYPELFVADASLGAPPDPYSAEGQNWGLPPIRPRELRAQHYRYWIQLLRRAFEHSGALRIDHVMGLFRTFWIPNGGTGRDGAYIRHPSRDLLGILALESVRHDALVVGEDLGTVPAEVPPALKKWGILSSKVLYFEKDKRGFAPAKRYPPLALATANTHDLPTLAGFWNGTDIDRRASFGLLPQTEVAKAKRDRQKEKEDLLHQLRLHAPPHYEEAHFPRRLTGAVHDFLCSSRSQLVGLSLDDITGETEPVNVPGVGPDKYPSWRRRMRMTMEEIGWSFEVDDAIRCNSRRSKPR